MTKRIKERRRLKMEETQRLTTELNKLVDQIVEDTATQIVKNGVNPEVATRKALKLLADKISELLKAVNHQTGKATGNYRVNPKEKEIS